MRIAHSDNVVIVASSGPSAAGAYVMDGTSYDITDVLGLGAGAVEAWYTLFDNTSTFSNGFSQLGVDASGGRINLKGTSNGGNWGEVRLRIYAVFP